MTEEYQFMEYPSKWPPKRSIDPAFEVLEILKEDSEEGEWLRKRKAYLDNIIKAQSPNNKPDKIMIITPFTTWRDIADEYYKKEED